MVKYHVFPAEKKSGEGGREGWGEARENNKGGDKSRWVYLEFSRMEKGGFVPGIERELGK